MITKIATSCLMPAMILAQAPKITAVPRTGKRMCMRSIPPFLPRLG